MESSVNEAIAQFSQRVCGLLQDSFQTLQLSCSRTSSLTVCRQNKAGGITIIAVGIHTRKTSIPAGVIREAFVTEEGFESTHEICPLTDAVDRLRGV